ncbi:MAG: HEAT repeat domain-containing protein [Peptococcaceae bacterium]|nr:HEAT repeat domain-containing protein [Peptococcaceae bacterium]
MQDSDVTLLQAKLIDSHWPACNNIATRLADIGTLEAMGALVNSLQAKRHHIRTAVIGQLVRFNDLSVLPSIERCLSDSAYETRMAAKAAVYALTGNETQTSRGE